MITDYSSKIFYDFDEIIRYFGPENRRYKKLVFVNGTFDLLHPGHISLLNQASKLGDILMVLTNTDDSISFLKGPDRPIISLKYRLYSLASLECVDVVFPFSEIRVSKYLEKIKPDFWAKASDYSLDTIEKSEKEIADMLKIEIKILPKIEGFSSTDLIKKIKNST